MFFTDNTLEALAGEFNTRRVFTDEIVNTLMSEAVFTVRPHRKPLGELVTAAWHEGDVTVGLLFDNESRTSVVDVSGSRDFPGLPLVSLRLELTWDDKVSMVLSINGFEAAREQLYVTGADVVEFKNTLAKHGVVPV